MASAVSLEWAERMSVLLTRWRDAKVRVQQLINDPRGQSSWREQRAYWQKEYDVAERDLERAESDMMELI